MAGDEVHLVLLEEEPDATGERIGGLAAALHRLAHVETQIVAEYTVIFAVTHGQDEFGVFQQRLGGNAAPVQTHASWLVLFNHHRFQTQLGCANRRNIPPGTSSYHRHVIVI